MTLDYSCLYDSLAFHYDEKSANKIFGVDLGGACASVPLLQLETHIKF